MGKFVDILMKFNTSKRAKIFAWSLIAFGTLLLLLGVMFVLMNPSSPSPSQITLTTSSAMPHETRGEKTGYHLQLLDPTTSILTDADKSIPIKFSTQQTHLIEITPAVMPGQAAIIKIKRDYKNEYYLSGEFTIQVSCGSLNTVIYGEIILTQQKTEIIATLQKEITDGVWEETTFVRPDIFDDTKYRVNVIFKAFGQVRCTTLNPEQIANFGFVSIDQDIADITQLFGSIEHTLTNAINDTFSFDLWVDFEGNTYHSTAPFSITFTTVL